MFGAGHWPQVKKMIYINIHNHFNGDSKPNNTFYDNISINNHLKVQVLWSFDSFYDFEIDKLIMF